MPGDFKDFEAIGTEGLNPCARLAVHDDASPLLVPETLAEPRHAWQSLGEISPSCLELVQC